jgi:hypothetical protein
VENGTVVPRSELHLLEVRHLKKIQESSQRLAKERYILQDDVPTIVQEAGRHRDFLMTPATPTTQTAR